MLGNMVDINLTKALGSAETPPLYLMYFSLNNILDELYDRFIKFLCHVVSFRVTIVVNKMLNRLTLISIFPLLHTLNAVKTMFFK